jgi:GntR family transcriptional regulator, carbon starvation induced regulator
MARARSTTARLRAVGVEVPPAPTLASTVVDRLRAEIVQGSFSPGEKLRLEHIAARYGVGRTPLREACCRLVAEGLVSIVDQRGFRVSPISHADLLDLTRTRQQLESLALRSSITRGGLAWEAEVSAALQRLQGVSRSTGRRAPSVEPARGTRGGGKDEAPLRQRRAGPLEVDREWEEAHGGFHAALLGACDSPWLLRFHALLFGQSERYRRLSTATARGAPQRDVAGEHEALARAALDRDIERACALLVEHIARTTERVLALPSALAGELAAGTAAGAGLAERRARAQDRKMSTK